MANLVYGVTIKNDIFMGEEVEDDNNFLRTIKTSKGETIVIPYNYKTYDTAEERNIAIFTSKKNQLSISKVALDYNITIEEATNAYKKALERFPEKFI